MKLVEIASFVDTLAQASGAAILPFFRTSIHAVDKSEGGIFDPVTEADRAAETAMRRMIKDAFPGHGIVGEEFGAEAEDAEYVWVLDPIDGTKSFIAGMPVWGTLIGLNHDGKPTYGMMHQPFTREMFSGDCEAARWRGLDGNGKPVNRMLHTRKCSAIEHATLMTTHPDLLAKGTRKAYRNVEKRVRLSRYGGDCYAYCMLAAGHVDLVIESGLNAYDIVGLVPIIEGAGGKVTSWSGGSPASGGSIIAAGDHKIHAQALELLNS